MVDVLFDSGFKKDFLKIKDKSVKEKIIKQVSKLKTNPEIGKPMRFSRKGTRELYISPFRLSYRLENDTIHVMSIYHKDQQ